MYIYIYSAYSISMIVHEHKFTHIQLRWIRCREMYTESSQQRRFRGRRGGGRAPRQRPTQRSLWLLPAGCEAGYGNSWSIHG